VTDKATALSTLRAKIKSASESIKFAQKKASELKGAGHRESTWIDMFIYISFTYCIIPERLPDPSLVQRRRDMHGALLVPFLMYVSCLCVDV
jgi:hypothetical protein